MYLELKRNPPYIKHDLSRASIPAYAAEYLELTPFWEVFVMPQVLSLPTAAPPLTVQTAVDAFLSRRWSANTQRNYASDLKRFVQAFGSRPVATLAAAELQDYLDGLTNRQGDPVAAETYNRHHGTLHNLFGWLVKQEEIDYSPMDQVDRQRLGERLPRPMTPGQVQTFFGRIQPRRDGALFALLYGSGLRIAEALSLNVEDLDLSGGTLRVVGKGDRERVGYLAEEATRWLRRYLRERGRPTRGPLFLSRQGRLSYAMAGRLFRKYAAGLEENGQPLTIHQLRHTFGSERAGQMDALVLRDLMGHQSLRTTLQYSKVNPAATQAAFKAFDRQRGR